MSEQYDTVRSIIEGARFAMLTTVDEHGRLTSRPLTVQRVTEDGEVLFIVPRTGDAARQADGRQVNLAFAKDMDYVSLAGTGELRDDRALLQELWNAANEAFTDPGQGPDDPDTVVLVVSGESAEYWSSPSKPALLVGMAKAMVTGERPEGGESGTVQL